jgi:parvulin-like peptidyl-prolyl isomerase
MPVIVNGETIDDSLIRAEAAAIRPRLIEAMEGEDPIAIEMRAREWAQENVIERVLLQQAALNDPDPLPDGAVNAALERLQSQTPGQSGCVMPGDSEALRRDTERQLRLERLISRITDKVSPPRNKDITEYYRKHRNEFFAPEVVHAGHIIKNVGEGASEEEALAAIQQVEAELKQGGAFEELADRYSDCPGRGGDLGFFPRGQMVPEFEQVVFSLEPGQISPIFRSCFGYHIAKLYERRPEGVQPLEQIRGDIEAMLHTQKKQRALEQHIDRLRASASIQGQKAQSK